MEAQIIANALFSFLGHQIHTGGTARSFFRLDGFEESVYQALLKLFQDKGAILVNQPLQIRTSAPVEGFEAYTLDVDKSATWYRNHVKPGEALILIFNQRTSDSQSIKDIYPVTENLLATDGLDDLINAAFSDYQLLVEQNEILRKFINRFRKNLPHPQLRDLVIFLSALNTYLSKQPGTRIADAIAEALPDLGLFRCREFAAIINTPKGDRLLTDIYRAATLRSQLIDDVQLNKWLKQLEKADFDDEQQYGGPSEDEKRKLLFRFLTDILAAREEWLPALRIDWSEVANVLFQKARKSSQEKLMDLATEIGLSLAEQQLPKKSLPTDTQEVLDALAQGEEPDIEGLEKLVDEYGDSFSNQLKNQLRRLQGTKRYEGADFLAGLMDLAVQMLSPIQDELSEGVSLNITFDVNQIVKIQSKEIEALFAFRILYGGIESSITSVHWELDSFWRLLQDQGNLLDSEQTELDEDGEREKIIKFNLAFTLRLTNQRGEPIDLAELIWQYRSDSPAAGTLAQIRSELSQMNSTSFSGPLNQLMQQRLRIPIYSTSPEIEDINDLNLSQPIKSFGVWYQNAIDLRQRLQEELEQHTQPENWEKLSLALSNLEFNYADFIKKAAANGILTTDLDGLLGLYQSFLQSANENLQSGREILYGFRLIPQAWIIGPSTFEDWAVVPILHPIKLHWWRERVRQFNNFIERLLDPDKESPIVDAKRFRQELAVTYGSANYPALIALPDRSKTVHYFLPVQEIDGYELFRRADKAGLSYGLDPDLVPDDESEQAAKVSARELAGIVQDYIETYPFVRKGLEIYIVQCRNNALPGLLVEQLNKITKPSDFYLSVIIHVTPEQGGAPLYRRVTEWIKTHSEFVAKPAESYLPPVTLRVLECSFDDLVKQQDDTDLVLLPDVLAEKGQKLESSFHADDDILPPPHQLPTYRILQAPFERDELTRNIHLTPVPQLKLLQFFYNTQWSAYERKKLPFSKNISFQLQVSLLDWEKELTDLHHRFNWVVCYDTTVDRFLLEATLPDAIEVIRYSLGLGIKRRHNMTVSSSYRSQDIVVRRLTTSLEKLLPGAAEEHYQFRHKIAERLVKEAKQVSGDIVLRAAGPGVYLNELIGLVVAKYITESTYIKQHPGALTTWIYLDDFSHWFDHKRMPDLLFVAIPPEANGELPLHIELLETKCVGESSFVAESSEAQQQVTQGLNRLYQALQPGKIHLDAPYWYNQLYQAVVGNLSVQQNQMHLWKALRNRLPDGNFSLEMSGHAWVFCYDGTAGIVGQSEDGNAKIVAPEAQDVPHLYHHFGRAGLRKALQALVKEWQYESPSEIWSPSYDLPSTSVVLPDLDNFKDDLVPTFPTVISHDNVKPDEENKFVKKSSETEPIAGWLDEKSRKLTRALRDFSIQIYPIELEKIDVGPSVVRFKTRLWPGETIGHLQRISADLQRELAIDVIPLIANVRGTHYVGIDLPHPSPSPVPLLPLMESQLSKATINQLIFLVGKTPDGQIVSADLAKLPHLLVAGSTGSGKTVFLYTLISSLIHQFGPNLLSLLLIDPKQTDFIFFEGLPHLIDKKVITDPEEAIEQLHILMEEELEKRTQKLREARSRDIFDYNSLHHEELMGSIVVVIDEYADLVQVLGKNERQEFERQLVRLAQRARNVGIHLVVATQRPSADIVTPRLKINLPARIAFRLPSHHDSVTILDQAGAENLLGKGDMLFRTEETLRVQAPFISSSDLLSYIDSRIHRK